MNIEELRDYCVAKKGVTESFPFDNDTLVFKVAGKIFLLVNVEKADSFNVKCDPEEAIKQREAYSAIVPGYHMNKKHWNTVLLNHGLNRQLLCKLIDDSYQLIIKGLPKKVQEGYL